MHARRFFVVIGRPRTRRRRRQWRQWQKKTPGVSSVFQRGCGSKVGGLFAVVVGCKAEWGQRLQRILVDDDARIFVGTKTSPPQPTAVVGSLHLVSSIVDLFPFIRHVGQGNKTWAEATTTCFLSFALWAREAKRGRKQQRSTTALAIVVVA
jgi:hypothetical protein